MQQTLDRDELATAAWSAVSVPWLFVEIEEVTLSWNDLSC